MKLKNLLTTSLLALAGAAFSPPAAHAQTPVAYTADDLFLGFRKVGATTDYLVNIGQASQYRDFAGTSFTLAIGNILPDLNTVLGAGWQNNPNVFWSVSGTPGLSAVGIDLARTLYATREELVYGIQSGLWSRGSTSAQGPVMTKMNGLAQAYLLTGGNPNNSTTNSNFGLIQDATIPVNNPFVTYMDGGANSLSGTSFAYFNPGIEGGFANGTGASQLDLVRLLPGSGAGEFVGTFTMNDSGVVTFNNNVVPEPTSFAIVGSGVALLGLVRRRRSINA